MAKNNGIALKKKTSVAAVGDDTTIGRWLSSLKNVKTAEGYLYGAKKFFCIVEGVETISDADLEIAASKYIARVKQMNKEVDDDGVQKGLYKVAEDLSNINLLEKASPKTKHLYVSAMKKFFRFYNVNLTPTLNDTLGTPKGHAITGNRAPTKEELQRILQHCDVRMRAFVLMSASSGMRLNEVMTTEIKNVHLTDDSGNTLDPPMIYIPAPKGDVEPRWTCMTSEAADAVRAWLAVRTDYMTKGAVIAKRVVRVKNVANADSTRLFPFVPELMEQRFRKACTAAGVCKKSSETGHHIITVHSLRRYTDTRLYEIGMHSFGEKLLGHDSEDVRHLYSRLTPEQIAKEYKKVEHALLLNVSADKYEQVIMSEQQNTESIDTLRRQLDVQKAENENLKRSMDERIAHLEQQIAERDRDMRVFMQQVTKGMYRVVTNDDDRDLAKKMYEAAGRK